MQWLAPWSLLWLGSLPVLLWLWRLSTSRRQIRIPSLVPFEHLLARRPARRSQLIVTLLFWIQLAALIALALALAQPARLRAVATTTLVLIDTSASMSAHRQGVSAMERARRLLLDRMARKPATEQIFLMQTAPVAPLLARPTSRVDELARAIHSVRVSHLSGDLTTAARLGEALLGRPPQRTLVVTDEPVPSTQLDRVQWVGVGEAIPNVAIVGLDAQGLLCAPAAARLVVAVENFSPEPAQVQLSARQRGRQLAEARAVMAPRARQSLPLVLPQEVDGDIELVVAADRDGLEVDNRAWIDVRRSQALPIVIHAQRPSVQEALVSWAQACQALRWRTEAPADGSRYVLITDQPTAPAPAVAAVMRFDLPEPSSPPTLSHWMVALNHPIGSYLAEAALVAAPLNHSPSALPGGMTVVSSVASGMRTPVVVAEERGGRRHIVMGWDPSSARDAPVPLLVFLNSLRWLLGGAQMVTTGEGITSSGWAPGTVRILRPDGSPDVASVAEGMIRYEATTLAGRYRLAQRGREEIVAVNFVDPVESNLIDRVSTWRDRERMEPASTTSQQSPQPLAPPLIGVILVLLLVEWWRYSFQHRP